MYGTSTSKLFLIIVQALQKNRVKNKQTKTQENHSAAQTSG